MPNIETILGKVNKYNKKLMEDIAIFTEKYSLLQTQYSNISFASPMLHPTNAIYIIYQKILLH